MSFKSSNKRYLLTIILIIALLLPLISGCGEKQVNFEEEILEPEDLKQLLNKNTEKEREIITRSQQELISGLSQEEIEKRIETSLKDWLENQDYMEFDSYILEFTRDDLLVSPSGDKRFCNLFLDLSLLYDWESLKENEEDLISEPMREIPFALRQTTEGAFLIAGIDLKMSSLGNIARYQSHIGFSEEDEDYRLKEEEKLLLKTAFDFIENLDKEVLESLDLSEEKNTRAKNVALERFGQENDRILAEIILYFFPAVDNLEEELEAISLGLYEELLSSSGDYINENNLKGLDVHFQTIWNKDFKNISFSKEF